MGGFQVVICGGGVAALEGLLRLRSLAGDRVTVTLVSPSDRFVYRPLAVREAVGARADRRYDVSAIAADAGAEWIRDTIASVDPAARLVKTGEGRELRYDALLVAVAGREVFGDISATRGIASRLEPPGMFRSSTRTVGL
jgi:sulfide:quinone oxidoreductase